MDKIMRFLTKEHALIGLSITRIFFGIALLYELLINIPIRYLLWGPKGLVPFAEYRADMMERHVWTIFDLSPTEWMVDLVIFGGILICLLYIIGFQTRIMGVLMFVIMFSLYMRNLDITHGGDNILRILLLYIMFTSVGRYFSVDQWLKKRREKKAKPPSWLSRSQLLTDSKAVIHNFAWLACVIQLVFMYFSSGSYKIMGSLWQNGTGLYYASRVQDFFNPDLTPLLWKSDLIMILMSYGTVLFQVAFPFLLLNRFTKYVAILSACMLHIGIAAFMGLVDFSWIMIGCEMMLLTNTDFYRLRDYSRQIRKRFRASSEQKEVQIATTIEQAK
ncbi:TQO small subunit DoxD [Seinonella peptonophila]|uniref:TQO small subunit DoxD n=2 Tax=Seinonella peptonophila TaxID=112248 RepID=A0A1M4VHH6_9BACL|nr:TQO small subunit DoxD [Seinonella peptonophila]